MNQRWPYHPSVTTLVLSSRHTADDQALWRAAIQRDWATARVRGITVPDIADPDIAIYVEALLAPTIADILKRSLLDPSESWLVELPEEYRKREIRLTTLESARRATVPAFVKPPNDKSFTAQVFERGADLPDAYDDETPVLVAEPVSWTSEYRCFCLDGKVLTASPYLLDGELAAHVDFVAPSEELAEARTVANNVLAATRASTPRAIVIDVGIIADRGWAVVEANGAWGAGIYGCDPHAVLDVIRCANVPR